MKGIGVRVLEHMEPGAAAKVLARKFHGTRRGFCAKHFGEMSVTAAARILEEMDDGSVSKYGCPSEMAY